MRIANKASGRFRLASIGVLGVAVIGIVLGLAERSSRAPALSKQDLESQVLQIVKAHPQVVIESVQNYRRQQQKEQEKAKEAVRKQLTSNPKSFVGDSPITGALDQKIILAEFSDFQCPFCAKAHQTLKDFMAANGKEVTFVYKHLPLEQIHPEAMPAAMASWAAARQGKFWEFHDALFKNQDKLGEDFYVKTAKRLNLNLEQFNSDRKSKAARDAIHKDMDIAEKLGISGTPHFLINGIPLSGAVSRQDFDKALVQAKQELAKSAP